MKRVYLDQNKWIDLAATHKTLPKAQRFQDALLVAEEGVERGFVSFPLSSFHYLETSRRGNPDSRFDLAATMAGLSRLHTIAPHSCLLGPEVDRALRVIFGVPHEPRTAQVFGYGVHHAFGVEAPPWLRDTNAHGLRDWVEFQLLALNDDGPVAMPEIDEIAKQWADSQSDRQQQRAQDGWHRGERGGRLAKVEAYAHHHEVIGEGLQRAGLHWGHLYELGQEGLSAFIEAVPLIHVGAELQRIRHAQPQKGWEPNDLNDLGALTLGVVYCDVVVTERQWVDALQRARLPERYGTEVLSDLTALPAVLVGQPNA